MSRQILFFMKIVPQDSVVWNIQDSRILLNFKESKAWKEGKKERRGWDAAAARGRACGFFDLARWVENRIFALWALLPEGATIRNSTFLNSNFKNKLISTYIF